MNFPTLVSALIVSMILPLFINFTPTFSNYLTSFAITSFAIFGLIVFIVMVIEFLILAYNRS